MAVNCHIAQIDANQMATRAILRSDDVAELFQELAKQRLKLYWINISQTADHISNFLATFQRDPSFIRYHSLEDMSHFFSEESIAKAESFEDFKDCQHGLLVVNLLQKNRVRHFNRVLQP